MTPSRASKSPLARSRSRAILVTSTSTTVVSCAETCSDSTIRWAMTLRSRDIFSVVPRSAATSRRPAAAAPPEPAAGPRGGSRRGGGLLAAFGGVEHVLLADPATDAGAGDVERSTPCSVASRRTSGVT